MLWLLSYRYCIGIIDIIDAKLDKTVTIYEIFCAIVALMKKSAIV